MAPCVFPVSQALREHRGEDGGLQDFVDYAQLDAFTSAPFKGNPAMVCLLPIPRAAEWMQSVAAEFSAPMTAFLVQRSPRLDDGTSHEFDVRFFTPTAEVDLCGHATLASAYLMFTASLAPGAHVVFHTPSGTLQVSKLAGGEVELSLPFLDSWATSIDAAAVLPQTLGSARAISTRGSTWDRLIVELPTAADVETLTPCFPEIARCGASGGVIVTAKGAAASPFDFVSRFFAPQMGVPEDPVCGTAHCALAPFWTAKLGKKQLLAYQASQRGGVLELCVDDASRRVVLRGSAVIVSAGVLLS